MGWEKMKTIPCVITLIIVMLCNEGYGQESVMSHLLYNSEINHRYAVTWVTAHMKNPSNKSTEIVFKMTLPKTAFISGLIMEVGGRNYTSRVEDKKVAQETYNEAKKRGNHAGLVEQSESAEQKFQVSTNVEARGKVIFYLKYEELLLRSKGEYTQNIQINPGVKPSKLDVTVHIKESEEITDLKVVTSPLGPIKRNEKGVMISNSNGTHVDIIDPNEAVVSYSSQGQAEGLYGELTLTYDVKREKDAGEIQVSGGYFVHFFSPAGLEKMAAHTVFILDISGSMNGEKLRQLKQSMLKILNDLKPEDSFELLTFHSDVQSLGVYNKNNTEEMTRATQKISGLETRGSTNINDALIKGFENVLNRNETSANQVVFLTDGEANAGETRLSAILRNVKEINTGRLPLYSLAFGDGADLKFLNKISFHNRGFARKIPVDSNTDKILQGFYQEIGTPLMTDIDIQYSEEDVDRTTIVKKGWTTLQSGNEVIVAGQLKPGRNEILPEIDGITMTGSHTFKVPRVSNTTQLNQKENFIARLWAYLTIQDLLNTAEQTDDANKVEELNARARSLALKHNFVTKLTSLVVVRQEDLNQEDGQTDEETINEYGIDFDDLDGSLGATPLLSFAPPQRVASSHIAQHSHHHANRFSFQSPQRDQDHYSAPAYSAPKPARRPSPSIQRRPSPMRRRRPSTTTTTTTSSPLPTTTISPLSTTTSSPLSTTTSSPLSTTTSRPLSTTTSSPLSTTTSSPLSIITSSPLSTSSPTFSPGSSIHNSSGNNTNFGSSSGCSETDGFFSLPSSNQCFKAYPEQNTTWATVKSFCENAGLVLAEPMDDVVAIDLQKYLNDKYGNETYGVNGKGSGPKVYWQRSGSEVSPSGALWIYGGPREGSTGGPYCLVLFATDFYIRKGKPYHNTGCNSEWDTHRKPLCERIIK